MNKELEEWIAKSNPHHKTSKEAGWYFGYIEGAKAMAEHLKEQNRTENDTAFLLGMESAKGVQLFGIEQPPTKDQIAKVISILDNIGNGCQNLVYDCNITAEIILEHWNDDNRIENK